MSVPEEEGTLRAYTIRFTPRARADVDAAHARLAELSGSATADEWKAGLIDAAATLATLPGRCQVAPESSRFRQEIRQLAYQRRRGSVIYRVLFTLVTTEDDAPIVRILHVRHGASRPITGLEVQDIEAE